jgi:hypothetical protein
VSMGRLIATQRLKWFAPTRIENKAQCEAKAYYISSSPSCAKVGQRRDHRGPLGRSQVFGSVRW